MSPETPPWPVDKCDSCGAGIVRAIHERTLKSSVVDAEPSKDGNIELVAAQGAVIYRILSTEKRFGRTNLRMSHFATCPNADSHRRKRAAA